MRFEKKEIPITVNKAGNLWVHYDTVLGSYVVNHFLDVETKPWFKDLEINYGKYIGCFGNKK